jgi:hypothetical protein
MRHHLTKDTILTNFNTAIKIKKKNNHLYINPNKENHQYQKLCQLRDNCKLIAINLNLTPDQLKHKCMKKAKDRKKQTTTVNKKIRFLNWLKQSGHSLMRHFSKTHFVFGLNEIVL